uniref:Chromosome 7 open reading frame 25 n=1 Tax=Sander lucioperca TaxID=283035 RepID=A0A8D0AQS2_SANLU
MSFAAELQQRIVSAESLLQRAELLSRGVEGQQKLCGKLRAELRFLRRVEAGELQVKQSHLHSTNLTHLSAIVESAESLEGVVALLHVFTYQHADARGRHTLVVDVVANGGHTWVKAVGRKAEALHNIWQGRGQYGDKSIISQAEDFLRASLQQPVQYHPPHVVFAFYNGVSAAMAQRLRDMGVSVRGDIVAVSAVTPEEEEEEEEGEEGGEEEEEGEEGGEDCNRDDADGEEECCASRVQRGEGGGGVLARLAFPPQLPVEACQRVNLDITSLITLVSALSHGRCRLAFREPVLTEQAAQERREPVLPSLHAFMAGKELFACRAAVSDFQLILTTLGGPGERQRAAALLQRVTVVEDRPSPRTLRLAPSAKVTPRSLSIFGTGDSLRAVTMTANSRFIRAAANQGVRYSVFVHPPRALTEGKEWRATPV